MRDNSTFTPGPWLAAAVLAFAAFGALAKSASVDEARLAARTVDRSADANQQAGPWWQAFGESALADLQQAARARSAAAGPAAAAGSRQMSTQAQVAVAYVAMRTYSVRWHLALDMRDSLDRQRQILAASAPVASLGDSLARLDDRRARADGFATALLGQRDSAIAALANLTGSTATVLTRDLQAALAIREMPVFDAQTPERLPRSVLMARRDVSASQGRVALGRRFSPEAEHQLAIGATSLGGWIEAADAVRNAAAAPTESALPDVQDLIDVAAKAETEISVDLADLQHRTAEAGRLLEVVKTRQLDVESARRRTQVGAGSEHDVIRSYQFLLVSDDELAVAAGELAYAWVRLQSSTGGQAIQARGIDED